MKKRSKRSSKNCSTNAPGSGNLENVEAANVFQSNSLDPIVKCSRSVDTYAAQCDECLKWRVIATEEEFEEIRSKLPGNPFVCERINEVSCEDDSNIGLDSSRTWILDSHGLPKTPNGYKRSLVLRKDFSKIDVYYITPTGKKLRSAREIEAFMDQNPFFKDAVSNFSFTAPKVMEETIPPAFRSAIASSSSKKRKAKKYT